MFNKIIDFFNDFKYRWYEPNDTEQWEQCPCCDYFSLPERGHDLICGICFWEDNGLDINQPDVGSGANHGLTLREGRQNFNKFGACELAMKVHVINENERQQFEHKPRSL